MKKKGIMDYIALYMLLVMLAFQTTSLTTTLFATDTNGPELSDILNNNEDKPGDVSTTPDNSASTDKNQGSSVIDGITSNLDYSKGDSEIVEEFGKTANYYVGIVVQCIAYIITGAFTVSRLLDIIYVAIPISRTFLANGYMGNSMAAGNPQQGAMGGGMMGSPMGGGMPGMGGGMMGGGMYGRGRYGMGGGMMGGGMMSPGGMDSQMAMQNQPARGRVQFVSNAALNAVATESVLGTDGKGQSAWKIYFSDMLVSSIAIGVLLVLCLTGVMAKFGFVVGDFIVRFVNKIAL